MLDLSVFGKIQLFKLSEDPSLLFIVKDALWFSILIVISLDIAVCDCNPSRCFCH